MPAHNLPMTMIGAALLWVGWFGFNAARRWKRTASLRSPSSSTFLCHGLRGAVLDAR
jgi:Amt family ammonium transporter